MTTTLHMNYTIFVKCPECKREMFSGVTNNALYIFPLKVEDENEITKLIFIDKNKLINKKVTCTACGINFPIDDVQVHNP